MKIIIVGSSGTIGRKVTADLEKDHEVIPGAEIYAPT